MMSYNTKVITIGQGKNITVTKRTVRFDKTVYQTHNISEFGEGEVEIFQISWIILITILLLGWFTGSVDWLGDSVKNEISPVLIYSGLFGLLWNLAKPQHYGFIITLNSGDKNLFITADRNGLKQVISAIYEFIETEKDVTYQISISNSQIRGNFIQGNARDVWLDSDN